AEFSPDGSRILTGSQDGLARFWDARSGQPLSPWLRHEGPVTLAAFGADGRLAATASFDGTVRLWDAATGEAVGPALRHGAAVVSVEFSADTHRLLTASKDGTVCLWDVSPDRRPIADLIELAQFLAAHRIDATGTLAPLE